jgi:dihydrofolate reductase
MKVSFIAAMSENRVIGNMGMLPWHLPHDLQHFKKLTLGRHILMGRKTFDSLKRPLPNRHNYVLTKNRDFAADNVRVFYTKAEVLQSDIDELIVIGGEELFKLFMPECEKIYLTLVHAVVKGDAYFPEFEGFIEKVRDDFDSDDKHRYNYSFIEYTRLSH